MSLTDQFHLVDKKGFTLLEALIAVFITSVGIFSVIAVFSAALSGASDSENTAIALRIAEDRMEEIQNLDYATGVINEARAAVPGFAGFERQVAVTEPLTDLKQVIVTVYWQSKGNDITLPLRTYISKN